VSRSQESDRVRPTDMPQPTNLGQWLDFLVERRRLLTWAMLAFMALLVVLDWLIPTGYGRFPWDSIGGFGAVYGFVSCVLIIVVSKALGYALLYRPENYYAAEQVPTDVNDATELTAATAGSAETDATTGSNVANGIGALAPTGPKPPEVTAR